MTLNFINMTTLTDEQFYCSRAESCLREAKKFESRPPEGHAFIVKFYRHRAAMYFGDLFCITTRRIGA